MPEDKEYTTVDLEYASVYEYVEKKYRDAWEKEELSGFLGGAKNRWEQFEALYRNNYVAYASNYPSVQELYEEKLEAAKAWQDEYYELFEIPEAEQNPIEMDEKGKEELWQEAKADLDFQISNSAAMDACGTMNRDIMLADEEQNQKDLAKAEEISGKAKSAAAQNEAIETLERRAAENPDKLEYVVRGAPLRCIYGSHLRYLDMHETHGVYLNGEPLIHSNDKELGVNIHSFGICSSPSCTLTESGSIMRGAEVDTEGNYLHAPDEQVLSGFICVPEITEEWKNTKTEVQIGHNVVKGMVHPTDCEHYAAVTDASYLICKHGGLIFPLKSGQIPFTAYSPAYESYPFGECEGEEFEKWCNNHNICPNHPATPEYYTWYRKKIDKALENGEKKEAKRLYEECLENAYQVGLDNMKPVSRILAKNRLHAYLESGLLTDKERKEIENRYEGKMRVDYGYNTQKNLSDHTPNQAEFYQYYYEEASANSKEIESMKQKIMENAERGNPQYSQEISGEMNAVWEEQQELYKHFLKEMELYQEVLSDEEKAQMQKVLDAFGMES